MKAFFLFCLAFFGFSSAFALDQSITTKLSEVGADVAVIGAAVLVVMIAIKGYKMLTKATS